MLSEIYDDITIEDAAYFSALYGPARHGIVVQDLSVVRGQLETLQDCPDVYFIEGDPQSFDDSVFDAQEFENAVLVRSSSVNGVTLVILNYLCLVVLLVKVI